MDAFPSEMRHGAGHILALDPTRLLLAFREPPAADVGEALAQSLDLAIEGRDDERDPPEIINNTDRRFWVRSRRGEPINQARLQEIMIQLGDRLEWIGPVFRMPNGAGRGGLICPVPNALLIKPAPRLTSDEEHAFAVALEAMGLREIPAKSKHLCGYRYYLVADPRRRSAYKIRSALLAAEGERLREAHFENMPMVLSQTKEPNDLLYPQQWNMTRIRAGGLGTTGWDISTGSSSVVVCILDRGCDLTHPDLQFATNGINLGTMEPDGGPTLGDQHGTACAGIAAGRFDNGVGVAGLAGDCQIMPLAYQNCTDVEIANGINYAADHGARVINVSFGQYAPGDNLPGQTGWNFLLIDHAIAHAVNDCGCMLCASTGNDNSSDHNLYPARNPLVIACGATDQSDRRKTPGSNGTSWGSNFGPGISVVAPGVLIPTTDLQGDRGADPNPSPDGDYFFFDGTSASTPHVAGFAALLLSAYPHLTNFQVRDIIERTAAKAGGLTYADEPGFPNGPRHPEMGYGLIDVYCGLDLGDVMIKDWSGDTGVEPSVPPAGKFWSFSDIVLRGVDDDAFIPDAGWKPDSVARDRTNYLYVRVTNAGPNAARNVVVDARLTTYVGTELTFPGDWQPDDGALVVPNPVETTFETVPAGKSVVAKFAISPDQMTDVWSRTDEVGWRPGLLAWVTADNDYAFANAMPTSGSIVTRRNNLAQRNLSAIAVPAGATVAFPFLAGSRHNRDDERIDILIDRSRLPNATEVALCLDEDLSESFPAAFAAMARTIAPPPQDRSGIRVDGGELVHHEGQRRVAIQRPLAVVSFDRSPGQVVPVIVRLRLPADGKQGDEYTLNIAQRNQRGDVVGGAAVVYHVQ